MKKFLLVVFLVAVLLVASFSLAMAKTGQVTVYGDGGKVDSSAFCSDKKEGEYHPVVSTLVNFFGEVLGVDEGDINGLFCEGFGIGQIALALQTAKVYNEKNEIDCSVNDCKEFINELLLVERRESGKGWGVIWKDYDLKGKDVKPGQAKKETPPQGQAKKENEDGGTASSAQAEDKHEDKTRPEQGKAKGKNKEVDHSNQGKGKGPKKTE